MFGSLFSQVTAPNRFITRPAATRAFMRRLRYSGMRRGLRRQLGRRRAPRRLAMAAAMRRQGIPQDVMRNIASYM